ncbi:cell division protein FtsQ [Pacificitalea manganoxidans]|uniref:Cell division protein FtsQ n=1 Tax=Pacificitalea manganoxidans TaxID=1411902 RepID=A0A291M1B5_9RHOB|nr:cell division protein FtsQ/DivIB [Pacificitalea manganoxidans]ATI42657.1 cell division protein FtsQ [Pacificitalea manganoxidans]MDR6307461.1 cell division protein FtsQ [Pacificitalea manganoxidans]
MRSLIRRGNAKPEAGSAPAVSGRKRRKGRAAHDPAPSRLAYRLSRLWLTPSFRRMLRLGVPLALITGAAVFWFHDAGRRQAITDRIAEIRRTIEERPEFMVRMMAIDGATPKLGQAVRGLVPLTFPISSFDLDLEEMRTRIERLDAVARAQIRVRPGGLLHIQVTERVPEVIWRVGDALYLLDREGHPVDRLDQRTDRPDLPLMAGVGAHEQVVEALDLFAAAEPMEDRLRGLVRVGERRWDVVLDREQRIMLPEAGAVAALERVIALDQAQDMLARDLSTVDIRNPARPTLRLTDYAVGEMRRMQSLQVGAYRQ